MHINDVRRMQDEKDNLMRFEGKHPANNSEVHRYKHELDEMPSNDMERGL